MTSLVASSPNEVTLLVSLQAEQRITSFLSDHIRTQDLDFDRRRQDYALYVNERHQHLQDKLNNLIIKLDEHKYTNLLKGMTIGGSFIGFCSFAAFVVYICMTLI
jgi:hypothetical protein